MTVRAHRAGGPSGPVIIDDVDAMVPAEGITCLLGPSGAGKSTLLRLCNRLEVPDEGRVCFRGRDLDDLEPLQLRRRVGMVFQRPTRFGGTVRDNLRVAVADASDGDMVAALARAELHGAFLDRQAEELSGGEAQRMCLARTLLVGPEALLMDEPTSALDPGARLALERLARELADSGVPMFWVTHDLSQADRLADEVVVLVAGRVLAQGSMDVVRASTERDVQAFLAGGFTDGQDVGRRPAAPDEPAGTDGRPDQTRAGN